MKLLYHSRLALNVCFTLERPMSCPICYQQILPKNRCVVFPCFHEYCYHCIVHWFKVKPICPQCLDPSWYIAYSIRSDDEYKLIEIRSNSLNIDCPIVYHPHLFINEHGEYECSVIETNRIRQLLGLPPLEESPVF